MPPAYFKYSANQIRRYRLKQRLKLKQVAGLIGLADPSHLSHWEKGRKMPTLSNALKLSAVIGCPVEILYADFFNTYRSHIFRKRFTTNPQ